MSMEINIKLLTEAECVFLLDGRFFEGDEFVTATDDVVFLTVLPLDAQFVPYTVKLIGHRVMSNRSLALSCKITAREYALKLGKRYSLIYSEDHRNYPSDECVRFFYFVKGGHFNLAAGMLSPSLRSALGDRELSAFFDEYADVIKYGNDYYAVDGQGIGHKCLISFLDAKIDDISIE